MSMRVSFEISDKDISHFRDCMHKARDAVKDAEDEEIIEAAESLFEEIRSARAPQFVRQRLHRLEAMVNMVRDDEWAMPDSDRHRVLCALVYFCDPEDLIPDSIPGIGFLDDAIMIELVFRELRHEIEAYDDFDDWRKSYDKRFRIKKNPEVRAERLEARRHQLLERVERRKKKDEETGKMDTESHLF